MKTFILIITLFLSITTYSQIDSTDSNSFYIGINTGPSMVIVENSGYLWRIGGTLFYSCDNNFLNLAYNKLIVFELKFDDDKSNASNAKYNRLDFTIGHTLQLSKKHKLFKRFFISADAGISYHDIYYYKDNIAAQNNSLSHVQNFGIPLRIALTNGLNSTLFGGIESRYHIVHNMRSYYEIGLFLAIRI